MTNVALRSQRVGRCRQCPRVAVTTLDYLLLNGSWWMVCQAKQNTVKERVLTLCKCLLHISPYPSEGVLRSVRWCGAGRGWPDGHGNWPADGVAGGRARGPCPLGLQKQDMPLVYFHKKCPHTFSKVSGPMLKKMVMTTFQNRSKPQETKETLLNLSAGIDCLRELSYIIWSVCSYRPFYNMISLSLPQSCC